MVQASRREQKRNQRPFRRESGGVRTKDKGHRRYAVL